MPDPCRFPLGPFPNCHNPSPKDAAALGWGLPQLGRRLSQGARNAWSIGASRAVRESQIRDPIRIMAAAPGFCGSRLQRSGSSRVPPPAVALPLPSEGGGSGSGPAGGDPVPGFGRDRPGKLPKLGSKRSVAARPSCGPAGA